MRKLANKAFGTDRAQKMLGLQSVEPRTAAVVAHRADEHARAAARRRASASRRGRVHPALSRGCREDPRAHAARDSRPSSLPALPSSKRFPEHAVAEASESLVRALEAAGGLASSRCAQPNSTGSRTPRVDRQRDGQRPPATACSARSPQADDKTATRIREAMFTFEDLTRIATREVAEPAARGPERDARHCAADRDARAQRPLPVVAVAARGEHAARRPVGSCSRSGCPRSRPRSAKSSKPRCGSRAKAS